MNGSLATPGTIRAGRFTARLDSAGLPPAEAWESVASIRFAADWQGKNEDPLRETEVRMLWTKEVLFFRFRCRYQTLTVFADSEPSGRRDLLWDRDVAEVFIQPDSSQLRHYLEFEVSPNGLWIDLEISPGGKRNPESKMHVQVVLNEKEKVWTADMAVPMRALAARFDPAKEWRINFFRVEGTKEPRFYSAWQPTFTPQPNFHVPEAFGRLQFAS
jgi:alpha-galactosidase